LLVAEAQSYPVTSPASQGQGLVIPAVPKAPGIVNAFLSSFKIDRFMYNFGYEQFVCAWAVGWLQRPKTSLRNRRRGTCTYRGGRALKVEGASQRDRWGRTVLPSLLGGCVLTGAERKDPSELVRELSEAVKPKLYAYDRCADAYPRAPT